MFSKLSKKKSVLDGIKLEKRLQKELMSLMKEPPPGMTVDSSAASQNLMQWIIQMDGAPGTLYEGEKFELLFKFSAKYPFDSPEVTFQGPNIPVHPHVYSNGHICLSILTEDWSPALSVQSVCLSIISMLSSCKEKKRPPDNSFYVKTCNKNPKKTKWWYHGKTRLLLAEKFKQFEGLIEQSANKTSEKEISINDLQGFWDLVLIQVNEVKEMFRGLGSVSSSTPSEFRKSAKSKSPESDLQKSGAILKKKSASDHLAQTEKKIGEIHEKEKGRSDGEGVKNKMSFSKL